MDCNSRCPYARTAGWFHPDLRAPPAPALRASSARPARETPARPLLQNCAPSEYSKPHRSSLSTPPPPLLLFLTQLPATLAQSANPYSCGTGSASSTERAGHAPPSPRNSPPHHRIRTGGAVEHPHAVAPQTSNPHHGLHVPAAPQTAGTSNPAAAFLRTNETGAANSPCLARETPAVRPVRTSSPAVAQFPYARPLRSPAAPPNPFSAAPLASQSLPSDCALLLLPDTDCCCA